MSYDNAEPKILKTLNSSGQVLDDAGNVISETSEYWVRTYNQAEPKVDKILYSDGTIKDGAGNLIQDTTPFNIKKYNQAEPIPAKYLHSDGTIDENPGSGAGANLEDNKEVEITENGEIEITPSSGYDGMKKVTATVNVSGGGGDVPTEWYLWQDDHGNYLYLPFATAPDTLVDSMQYITIGSSFIINNTFLSTMKVSIYTKISDSSFSIGRASYDRITENVPIGGGGATKLYSWYSGSDFIYTTTPTPSVGDKVVLSSDSSSIIEARQVYSVTEEGITIDDYEEATVYTRYSAGDVDLV